MDPTLRDYIGISMMILGLLPLSVVRLDYTYMRHTTCFNRETTTHLSCESTLLSSYSISQNTATSKVVDWSHMSRPGTVHPTGALPLIPQCSRAQEAKTKADKLKIMLHRHNIEVTKDVLDSFINKHESRKPRLFDKLQRVANNIQAFSKAIGSICQIHGIASVVCTINIESM